MCGLRQPGCFGNTYGNPAHPVANGMTGIGNQVDHQLLNPGRIGVNRKTAAFFGEIETDICRNDGPQ